MITLRRILAATDLSEFSRHAVARGYQIANTVNAQFTIIHALGVQALAPLQNMLCKKSDDIIHAIAHDAREQIRAMAIDPSLTRSMPPHIELSMGLPTYDVPDYVEKAAVNLILIGAQGTDPVHPLSLGSTTSRLLRKSQCPTLIVKLAPRGAYQRILIAVDFSPASEKAIQLAREIAPDAQIILCHVTHVPFENKIRYAGVGEDIIAQYRVSAFESASNQLHALAHKCGLQNPDYAEHILDGHAPNQILSVIEETGCDLVVVGKHGTHVTEELLIGSVTSHIVSAASCDVLVVFDKQIRDGMDFAA